MPDQVGNDKSNRWFFAGTAIIIELIENRPPMVELKNQLSRRYWGFRAFFYALYYRTPLLSAISRREHDSIVRLWSSLVKKPEGVCFDIACGSRPVELTGEFRLRIGLDASVKMLDYAKAVNNIFNFVGGDALEIPFKGGKFSVVTAAGLTEYLESPEGFLREIDRIMQNEGVLIFSFSQVNLLNNLRKLWNPRIFLRGEEEWKEYCGSSGFRVLEVKRTLLQTQFLCVQEADGDS